jgi:hypothetical protein
MRNASGQVLLEAVSPIIIGRRAATADRRADP